MTLRILVTWTVVLAGLPLMADNRNVTGSIVDIVTGTPISGATIVFFGETGLRPVVQATADASGHYALTAPDGRYYVVATRVNGSEDREARILVTVSADRTLNLRLGPRHNPGGEFARIIYGLSQAAAGSGNATFKYFFDLNLSAPLPFGQKQDPDFGARYRTWGNVRLASVPQQVTQKLSQFDLAGSVANLQVNELAQSIEYRGGLSARVADLRSLEFSFDKETLQKFALHAIVGVGATTPLNPRDTLDIFKVSPDAVARYPQAKGKDLIAFTSPDRDRFYRQAFGGIQLKTYYFDKSTEVPSDRFPATFDLTYGFDEAVTGGRIHGGVFRAEGFYPMPTKWGSQFYFFFTALMKPNRARDQDPLILEPATGKALSDVVASGVRVTLPQIDRDYYRVGIGMDIIRLIQNIQNKGNNNPPESK
jgi:hypothetical protein